MSQTQGTAFPDRISGGGIVLALTPDELYFETVETLPEKDLDALIARHKLEPMADQPGLFGASFNRAFHNRRWVRIVGGASPQSVVAALQADERVHLASPVYHRPDLTFKTALSFGDTVLAKYRVGGKREMADVASATGAGNIAVALEIQQADGVLFRLKLPAPKRLSALEVAARLVAMPEVKDAYPDWHSLTAAISMPTPNDTLFTQEWDMTQIGAPTGWDLSEGNAGVVIAIVDTGCDLNHEDLVAKYVPVAQRRDVVAGTNTPNDDFGHGTCCASLAAAATNNAQGAAGVGWNCRVMPIRMLQNGFINSEADIVAAIDWARTNGADVVSMSWFWTGTTAAADVAFAAAAAAGLVLVVASGNFNGAITYPATNVNNMAIGASDQIDQRKSPASPDGEGWGSNFGARQSVMAPGVRCWAANNTNGGASFNNNNGGPISWAGVNYPSSGTADERYFALMNGTSAATPHVAGLAGLLLSAYPALSNVQVRNIIEQTAEKTGGFAYADDGVHNNGTWHQEPGYGRISVFRALDYADVFIKGFPADTGARPFGGDFWDSSDIVIRQADDGIFANQPAVTGQDNYVYVRVNNAGPNTARNVTVNARAVAFLGTQFVYPGDFTTTDAVHIQPTGILTTFANLPAGTTAIARFMLSAAQIDTMFTDAWHSCLIANVSAANDYGSGDGPNVWENNNLGQLNFSVQAGGTGAVQSMPFVTGNRLDEDRYYELVIDRHMLPEKAELLLDPSPAQALFPALGDVGSAAAKCFTTTFLDRTRITARICDCDGVLTLEAGSAFTCDCDIAGEFSIHGGTIIRQGGRQVVRIAEPVAVIGIPKAAGELRVMNMSLRMPPGTKAGAYRVIVSQRNTSGRTVGGVTFGVTVG